MSSTALVQQYGIVAVIDDNARQRERIADYIETKSLKPLVFSNRLSSLEGTVEEAVGRGAAYAICDHRLFEGNYARFFGAQAVASFYDRKIAPVLVTGWENDDAETTIRPFRKKIPILLHSRDVNPDSLVTGLQTAELEIVSGIVPPEREACPSILTVVDVITRASEKVVRVIVSQWDANQEVGFPLGMVSPEIQSAIKPGAFLYADVNVDATGPEDLFFVNFSLPHPDDVRAIDS